MEGAKDILVKDEEKTNPDFGCEPDSRTVEERLKKSFVYLNKPSGPTSHQVTVWVKRMLGIEKAGYSGTLDPNVTGVLPIGLEYATRVLTFLNLNKEYVGILELHKEVPDKDLEGVLREFTGGIYQRPPLKSAVKRELRVRTIHKIVILEKDGRKVLLKVNCEAGTYVRKLCHDIGTVLGVGAHMLELRRTKVGWITEDDCIRLHDLRDAFEYHKQGDSRKLIERLTHVEDALKGMPKIWVKDGAVDSICHGATLKAPGVSKLESGIKAGDHVAITTLKGELISVGKALTDSKQMLELKKGEIVKSKRVFMETGVYPRMWKSD
ncbi:MAG: RNA-guided pseudouridylation complex pseudouridine synthase subunit Cbf5 [Candidatus Altiarchaeota archaeon]